MLFDRSRAPRTLAGYLLMMWVPVLTLMIVGPSLPGLVSAVVFAFAVAVCVDGEPFGAQARRVWSQVLAVLVPPWWRTPIPGVLPPSRYSDVAPADPVTALHVLRVLRPRAPSTAM